MRSAPSLDTIRPSTPMMQGRVIQATGAWHQVQGNDGCCYACQLRGKLRLQALPLTSPIVVGDEVAFVPDKTHAVGIIHKIMPRKNYLLRQAPYRPSYGQLLAANIDQALLVVSAVDISIQLDFINRFLVVTEAFAIPPLIVFNKIDLLDSSRKEALGDIRDLYQEIGYSTIAVSAHTQQYLAAFSKTLLGKVSLLSGHSGVGKSTLVNTIAPNSNQAVAPLLGSTQRRRHTTTYAALLEIAPDAFLIDTPGIQNLVPHAIEKQALSQCFPEIRDRSAACKFYNCTHQHEPNCAILLALERGEIATSRYKSYQQLSIDCGE